MKKLCFLIVFLIASTSFGYANKLNPYFRFSDKAKIEEYPNGFINWSEGYFLSKAKGGFSSEVQERIQNRQSNAPIEMMRLEKELTHKAKEDLLNLVLSTRVDSYNYVRDLFQKKEEFRILFLEDLRKHIIVLPPVRLGGDQIEAVVKYPIYGKGSLTDLIYRLDDNIESFPTTREADYQEPTDYTALIIDLRSSFQFRTQVTEKLEELPAKVDFPMNMRNKIQYDKTEKLLIFKGKMTFEEKVILSRLSPDLIYQDAIDSLFEKSKLSEQNIKYSPSVFPTIYDSHGNVIYSKNMVDKNFRSQIQFTRFTKDTLLFYKPELVGKNPLYVMASKIKGENNTDIIIYKGDAQKMLMHPRSVNYLKKGRVFLLVD